MNMMEMRYASKHLVSLMHSDALCTATIDVFCRLDKHTRDSVFAEKTGCVPSCEMLERMKYQFARSKVLELANALIDAVSPNELFAFYLNASKLTTL